MLAELAAVASGFLASPTAIAAASGEGAGAGLTNTEALGAVLYTKYMYVFQLSGLILLVALLGAIVLTLRHRGGIRRQAVGRQIGRPRDIEVVKVLTGSGV